MRQKRPTKAVYHPISMGDCVIETLSLPFVHYPKHYGTFIAFSETSDGELYLCECAKTSISHFFELRSQLLSDPNSYFHNNDNLILFDDNFIPQNLGKNEIAIKFKKSICHRCQMVPPKLRYCHEMYGGKFVQHYGWYINQTYLKLGILKNPYLLYLENVTPPEYINDIIEIKKAIQGFSEANKWFRDRQETLYSEFPNNQPSPPLKEIDYDEIAHHQDLLIDATRILNRSQRVLSTKIENIVRGEFGFRKIGDQWVSETLLFQIIKNLFPNEEIHKHYRPQWLNKLELDVFIPSLKLGIEYQGQQHYHAIPIWGGTEALKKIQNRDLLKKEYCRIQDIELITVDYTEPLTIDYIRNKIPNKYFCGPTYCK